MSSLLRVNAANTARTKPTTGDTKMSFINTDHLGWLRCDGRQLDKVKYNLLFQVLGDTFTVGNDTTKFNLPNPAGRVMGSIGTVTDSVNRTRIYTAGQSVGELDHKLIQKEMPSHNHDINGPRYTASPYLPVTTNGNTSLEYTGITINNNSTGITDSGHQHSYTQPTGGFNVYHANPGNEYPPGGSGSASTGIGHANINDPTHNHTIHDPTHSHAIKSNGNDDYHNNIQPTLFYGNTFIYSGIPMLGNFPFKTGIAPVLI
jgi:microcystin-dependent protein